jgi:hypothetical protein
MSDARTQLLSLLKMQELALEIQAAHMVVESAPAKIEEAEGRFRERNAEYVAIKERYEAVEADRNSRQLELGTLEETRKHYQDSLMQVKNQREYAAVLKEIDAAKAGIGEHEEAILSSMDEVESLKVDLEARAAHIDSERMIVEKERAFRDRVRGEGIHPWGVAEARQLGLFPVLAAAEASVVYELLGKKGLGTRTMPGIHAPVMNTVGYHIRAGKHDVTAYDWERYLEFADLQWKR